MKHLKDSYDQLQAEPEGFREMIRYELYNHECGYTGDYSEALSSLGIKEAKLTIEQQKILKEEFNVVKRHIEKEGNVIGEICKV